MAITFKICLFAFRLMLFQEAVVFVLGIETHRCQQSCIFPGKLAYVFYVLYTIYIYICMYVILYRGKYLHLRRLSLGNLPRATISQRKIFRANLLLLVRR